MSSLATRFKLPLPKPINDSFSSYELPITNSTNSQLSITSSLNVIPYQQTLINVCPIGRTSQSKRGRKPLTTMPTGKKHKQNLRNQRAFRQRKEDYLRTLETRAFNFEMLYNTAQDEIKILREKVAMLEKKLASANSAKNGGIVGSAMYHAIIDNPTTIYADGPKNKDESCNIINDINDQFTTFNDRNLSSFTPVTSVSSIQLSQQLKENDLSLSEPQQMSSKRKSINTHSDMNQLESVSEIDLLNSISSASKYTFDQNQKTGERIWLGSTTSPLYSTFVSDSSQNTRTFSSTQVTDSQWPNNSYFDQEQPTTRTSFASHHPLNLKSILSQNEE